MFCLAKFLQQFPGHAMNPLQFLAFSCALPTYKQQPCMCEKCQAACVKIHLMLQAGVTEDKNPDV
jgi:hypothetical protein